MTVIEIRPHRWGWKAFESPGVEPVFPKKDQAIGYAQNPRGSLTQSLAPGGVKRTWAMTGSSK